MKNLKINAKFLAATLILATAAGIALFPLTRQAQAVGGANPPAAPDGHAIEVVFILDTTSSMSGLIQAAKEKIWSIATTMASAQQNPDIRMGLVAFRDRGDAYVTRVYDLSTDLDSMYASLMDFRAQGGGDGPESVNQALYDAIHKISWSQQGNVYRVAFLVGDAPPHMDYQNDVKYPITLAEARRKGIVVNTIQSGGYAATRPAWRDIASLGRGDYFRVEDSGNAVAVSTPFDEKLAKLAAALEDTRLYYGDAESREAQKSKIDANARKLELLSAPALARRSTYNATASGSKNLLGERELVDAVTSGRVELDEIKPEDLPASLQSMAPEEAMGVITEQQQRRDGLRQEIQKLSAERDRYIREKVEAEGGAEDSLDEQIYRAVRSQAAEVGLSYDSDRAKY